ncbi:hypothetical protein BABINDRAFT_72124 [Babjeviella inositovora NRRL Y-12698]|uniref:Uncharacterized protein n=1 Tax=Babjeviella inositovora NRRL Y-12698 TaxID=984486 RepID=A0A1E3QXQ3_9ASCO|nr:uncharacterized protein BABINDRAFT_72124 [Babjeviella inositovora NRRL Y-12698]ODQ82443.1 hypothetical protein BABINDRAFT_72124 [Babjeviella inositovora NRRL Y-12698]
MSSVQELTNPQVCQLLPSSAENFRGYPCKVVTVASRPHISDEGTDTTIQGRLYNIDPITKTVILFNKACESQETLVSYLFNVVPISSVEKLVVTEILETELVGLELARVAEFLGEGINAKSFAT